MVNLPASNICMTSDRFFTLDIEAKLLKWVEMGCLEVISVDHSDNMSCKSGLVPKQSTLHIFASTVVWATNLLLLL